LARATRRLPGLATDDSRYWSPAILALTVAGTSVAMAAQFLLRAWILNISGWLASAGIGGLALGLAAQLEALFRTNIWQAPGMSMPSASLCRTTEKPSYGHVSKAVVSRSGATGSPS
jgi:hypothetical protein